ncbi:hypothetical protein HDV05_000459 [Chytridiales sp. JEL 0842]|nr:hypothetical protein HDV05_000459 [Chytridiales sp. JEL 0842]
MRKSLNPKVHHYIFGYGSLINPQSRLRTLPPPPPTTTDSTPITSTFTSTDPSIPVILKRYRRSWSYKCPFQSYTAVSITPSPSPSDICNGVLIKLNNPTSDLQALDARERCYDRVLVNPSDIIPWNNSPNSSSSSLHTMTIPENALIWVYQTKPTNNHCTSLLEHEPCPKFPIPQTYIDTILSGLLNQFDPEFLKLFIRTTNGWTPSHTDNKNDSKTWWWFNDREAPKGVRRYVPSTEKGERGVDRKEWKVLDEFLRESVDGGLKGRVEGRWWV